MAAPSSPANKCTATAPNASGVRRQTPANRNDGDGLRSSLAQTGKHPTLSAGSENLISCSAGTRVAIARWALLTSAFPQMRATVQSHLALAALWLCCRIVEASSNMSGAL
eukprot:CAMPEP_0169251866 /NCGR_PEP_ID=MMETSP1016-20121227/37750_1 /TAXON_ID=342587 /ORGANISM="Karlodinium micrum, Strain CCMP2283" /LENGTH=109 /DNA_ID=CAMNT_0009333049 /DNA_START=404 /DNA_END=730 /DNA_ORIENTATION=+